MKKNIRLALLCVPYLLIVIVSLPTLIIGFDSETINYTHNFVFEHRSPNLFADLANGVQLPSIISKSFRPLYYISFCLDFIVFDANVLWYRLENLLWLLLTLTLLLRFADKLGLQLWTKLIVGIFFALHPAHGFMMVYIYSRTDLMVAVFILAILDNFASLGQRASPGRQYYFALALMVISIFWKENLIVIPALLLLGDRALGWTKGNWKRRALIHLPFWLIAIISLIMQSIITKNLGYTVTYDQVTQIHLGIVDQMAVFSNYLLAIHYWDIPYLGCVVLFIMLIIGPGWRSRLLILATLIVLIPYLLVWCSEMHVFVASLGISLWAGAFIEDVLKIKYRSVAILILITLGLGLGVSWGMLYGFKFNGFIRQANKLNRIIEYVVEKYPNPQSDTRFIFPDDADVFDHGDKIKVLSRLNLTLQVAYRREDIFILPQKLENYKNSGNGQNKLSIHIPAYILK